MLSLFLRSLKSTAPPPGYSGKYPENKEEFRFLLIFLRSSPSLSPDLTARDGRDLYTIFIL